MNSVDVFMNGVDVSDGWELISTLTACIAVFEHSSRIDVLRESPFVDSDDNPTGGKCANE